MGVPVDERGGDSVEVVEGVLVAVAKKGVEVGEGDRVRVRELVPEEVGEGEAERVVEALGVPPRKEGVGGAEAVDFVRLREVGVGKAVGKPAV